MAKALGVGVNMVNALISTIGAVSGNGIIKINLFIIYLIFIYYFFIYYFFIIYLIFIYYLFTQNNCNNSVSSNRRSAIFVYIICLRSVCGRSTT